MHSKLGQVDDRHSLPTPKGVEDFSPGLGDPLRRTLPGVQRPRDLPAGPNVIRNGVFRRVRRRGVSDARIRLYGFVLALQYRQHLRRLFKPILIERVVRERLGPSLNFGRQKPSQ